MTLAPTIVVQTASRTSLPGDLLQVPSVQVMVPASAPLTPREGLLPPRGGLGPEVLDLMDSDDTQRLAIGRYAIPPPPVNGKQFAYPAIFFPAATGVADATTITLKYGEDRANVDLTLTPVTSVRVSGVVEGPPESLRTLTLRLLPAGLENLGFGAETATALVAADGRFTFLNVPAGDYQMTRRCAWPSCPCRSSARQSARARFFRDHRRRR